MSTQQQVDTDSAATTDAAGKKLYVAPALTQLGTILELTQGGTSAISEDLLPAGSSV